MKKKKAYEEVISSTKIVSRSWYISSWSYEYNWNLGCKSHAENNQHKANK